MKLLKPILISLIQIIGVVIIHVSLNHFYPIQHRSVGFGLTIFYTAITFVLTIIAFNFYVYFFRKNFYLIAFSFLALVSIFPLLAFDERPLRSLFLIILAFFGFLSSFLLRNWLYQKNMKPEI